MFAFKKKAHERKWWILQIRFMFVCLFMFYALFNHLFQVKASLTAVSGEATLEFTLYRNWGNVILLASTLDYNIFFVEIPLSSIQIIISVSW